MSVVHNFSQFGSDHWETGALSQILRHNGIVSPHTGKPVSEAFLFGVSGGACMGYFSFAYAGFDPHVALLSRNTFDPFEKMLDRLGVVRENIQSGSAEQAAKKLSTSLAADEPVLVWTDIFSMPYNGLNPKDMWYYQPIVVYGEQDGGVLVSDRIPFPVTVDAAVFSAARARVKKERFRSMTVDLPSTGRFAEAAKEGIRDCLTLYFDGPTGKIPKANFGARAYEHWAKLLVKDGEKQSWAKNFPAGRPLLAGLWSAYGGMMGAGPSGSDFSRNSYADFVQEAAVLLNRPALAAVPALFRKAGAAWADFKRKLLPDRISMFKNLRELTDKPGPLFKTKGPEVESEIRAIAQEQKKILADAERDFPLSAAEVVDFKTELADCLKDLSVVETAAFRGLADAMEWTTAEGWKSGDA